MKSRADAQICYWQVLFISNLFFDYNLARRCRRWRAPQHARKAAREQTLIVQGTLSNDPRGLTLYSPHSARDWSRRPHRGERRRERQSRPRMEIGLTHHLLNVPMLHDVEDLMIQPRNRFCPRWVHHEARRGVPALCGWLSCLLSMAFGGTSHAPKGPTHPSHWVPCSEREPRSSGTQLFQWRSRRSIKPTWGYAA